MVFDATLQIVNLTPHLLLQETLTDELLGMAAALKTNTMAFESRLKERGKVLDETDNAVNRSLDNARRAKNKATKIKQRCERLGIAYGQFSTPCTQGSINTPRQVMIGMMRELSGGLHASSSS